MNTITKIKKNKTGKIIEKRIILSSVKGKISIGEVNKLYKDIITKHSKKNFIIRGMGIDGIKTIKSMDYMEEDLKYALQSYYSSYGIDQKSIKDKFDYFFDVEIILFY